MTPSNHGCCVGASVVQYRAKIEKFGFRACAQSTSVSDTYKLGLENYLGYQCTKVGENQYMNWTDNKNWKMSSES